MFTAGNVSTSYGLIYRLTLTSTHQLIYGRYIVLQSVEYWSIRQPFLGRYPTNNCHDPHSTDTQQTLDRLSADILAVYQMTLAQ